MKRNDVVTGRRKCQMNSRCLYFLTTLILCLASQQEAMAVSGDSSRINNAETEVLDWNTEGQKNITCIYGEITVLASVKKIYFCGANWRAIDGYSGIQDLDTDRRTIFSIWDTSPTQHPRVIEAGHQTVFGHFDGEGAGAHTHMLLKWKLNEKFRCYLHKSPGKKPHTTETSFHIFDHAEDKWRPIATINSPNGPKGEGSTFNTLMSWIENIGGEAPYATPKVALFGLWVGSSPDELKHLTHTGGRSGHGRWGQLHGQYFLAEGSPEQLRDFFDAHKKRYGEPTFGVDDKELPPIRKRPLPSSVVDELKHLPQAPAVTKPTK